jgi:TM2 domain-containing membrane protein YozV
MAWNYDDGRTEYRTSDGSTFTTEKEAQEYQDKEDARYKESMDRSARLGAEAGKAEAAMMLEKFERADELHTIGTTCQAFKYHMGIASAFGELVCMLTDPGWEVYVKDFLSKYPEWDKTFAAFDLNHYCVHAMGSYDNLVCEKQDAGDFEWAIKYKYRQIKFASIYDSIKKSGKEGLAGTQMEVLGSLYQELGDVYRSNGDTAKANANYKLAVNLSSPDTLEWLEEKKNISLKPTAESLNSHAQAENNGQQYAVAAYLWQKAADEFGDATARQKLKEVKNPIYTPTPRCTLKVLADGNVYEGDLVNGLPHGKGKKIYTNGTVYEGDYANGKENGVIKVTDPDGEFIVFSFVDGKPVKPVESNTHSPQRQTTQEAYIPQPQRQSSQETYTPQPQRQTSSPSSSSSSTSYSSSGSGKNKGVLVILSVLLGFVGADRFYAGRIGLGVAKLISMGFGVGFIWWVIDIFLAITGKQKDSEDRYITGGGGVSTFIAVLLLAGVIGGGVFIGRQVVSKLTGSNTASQTGTFQTTATVKADAANLRSSPSTSGDIVKTLQKGDTLTVTGNTENGWVPVNHSGDTGWISADLINLADG